MKINNLKINKFGNLENKEIKFENKINIIYGKNESGKSTLLKYIVSMFYGLSKNKKGKPITDFEKYTPWEEGDFSGKLCYELDNGNKYEIFREFKKKNPKIFDENLSDISKKFTIDKTKGNMFFYDQIKIDEDSFLSTVVSEQQEIKLEKQTQNNLIQKTANLIGTGDDTVSFQKILNNLNKKQIEEIGTQRTQDRPINILEKRLNEIEKEKNELKENEQEKNKINILKNEIKNKINNEEIKLEIIKENKKIKDENILNEEKININKNYLNNFQEKIQEKNNELKNIKEIKIEEIKNKNNLIKNIIIPILLIIINLFNFIFLKNIFLEFGGILILIIYLLFNYINNKKINNKIKEQEKIKNKINENKKDIEEKIQQLKNEEKNKIEEIKKEEEKNKLLKEIKIKEIKNNYSNKLNEEEINLIINNSNINFLLDKTQNNLNELKLNFHKLEIEEKNILEKLEEISELEEEKQDLKEKYIELKNKNNCINMAKEEIEKAYIEMKENISPKFTKKLSSNIKEITDGKYTNVKINNDGIIMIETKNGDYVTIDSLSIGTIEQLYLSLRMSFVDDISKEKLPIMLDETFVYYDNERLENILKYINKEYKDRQILLFTCTYREIETLGKLKIPFNLIELC